MTRQEETWWAAFRCGLVSSENRRSDCSRADALKMFCDGAEWADVHPVEFRKTLKIAVESVSEEEASLLSEPTRIPLRAELVFVSGADAAGLIRRLLTAFGAEEPKLSKSAPIWRFLFRTDQETTAVEKYDELAKSLSGKCEISAESHSILASLTALRPLRPWIDFSRGTAEIKVKLMGNNPEDYAAEEEALADLCG